MKRRDILKAGSGALALTGLASGAAVAQTAAPAPFSWSRAAVRSLLGQNFWLYHPERRALTVVLKSVTAARRPAGMEQFSASFDSAEANMAAATYEMEHPAIGRFLLHLVPASASRSNRRYRADFNLLT